MLVAIILLAGTAALMLALAWPRRMRDLDAPPPAAAFGPLGPARVSLPADLAVRVLRETRGGHAVRAVKLVCDATGLDLAAAKATVDDLRRHDGVAR